MPNTIISNPIPCLILANLLAQAATAAIPPLHHPVRTGPRYCAAQNELPITEVDLWCAADRLISQLTCCEYQTCHHVNPVVFPEQSDHNLYVNASSDGRPLAPSDCNCVCVKHGQGMPNNAPGFTGVS